MKRLLIALALATLTINPANAAWIEVSKITNYDSFDTAPTRVNDANISYVQANDSFQSPGTTDPVTRIYFGANNAYIDVTENLTAVMEQIEPPTP